MTEYTKNQVNYQNYYWLGLFQHHGKCSKEIAEIMR
jgi:hypothetical protein